MLQMMMKMLVRRPLGDVAFVNVNVEALEAGFHRSGRCGALCAVPSPGTCFLLLKPVACCERLVLKVLRRFGLCFAFKDRTETPVLVLIRRYAKARPLWSGNFPPGGSRCLFSPLIFLFVAISQSKFSQ